MVYLSFTISIYVTKIAKIDMCIIFRLPVLPEAHLYTVIYAPPPNANNFQYILQSKNRGNNDPLTIYPFLSMIRDTLKCCNCFPV